jgi:hypothetical protein
MATGRPTSKLKYDIALVEELAKIFCTQQEIANIMGVSLRTLQRNEEFCRIYNNGIDYAKSTLRRAQFKSAIESGNVTMQIWLGKQYLSQREPTVDTYIPEDAQEDKMNEYEN